MHLRRNGERYRVSPWGLIWKDENYYLVALDEKSGIVKHYRVDKMIRIAMEKDKRNGEDIFADFDAARFASRTFGMFGGREETLYLEFENSLVGVVIDHFGQDVMIRRKDSDHFTVRVRVSISGQFFGWLAGIGPGAVIVSPESVRREYTNFLERALENYHDC
jgi:predicted DNA-binding transcriptional regulator YafY